MKNGCFFPFVAACNNLVDTSRRVAKNCGVTLCDANSIFVAELDGLDEAWKYNLILHNHWHVNDHGHTIYAKCAMKMITPLLENF